VTGRAADTRARADAQPGGEALGGADGLAPFRARLDELDEQIVGLLGERFEVCRGVARYKSEHDVPMMQPQRVAQVRERYLARGAQVGLPAQFAEALFELLIGATCRLEDELIAHARSVDATAASDGSSRG
jgi:4-amino-4-deoxychorismate mutase